MDIDQDIRRLFPQFDPDLTSEIVRHGKVMELDENIEILREGQYVKVIPIVFDGLIKVYTRHEDRELLLYYIQPGESCIMSFAASLKNEPSKIYASTEEKTKALVLPVEFVGKWIVQFPDINQLFFQQFNNRYKDLLETINHILFDKMDKRLFDHLVEKSKLTGNNPLVISHRQIANELGTVREVISRVMKKLESENKVKQLSNSVEILDL